jgi:hypothetical protein
VLNLEELDPDQIAWASSANAAPLGGRSLDTELLRRVSYWPLPEMMLILMAVSSGAPNGPTLARPRSGVWAAEVTQIASEYPATGVLARGAAVSP